MPVASAGSVDLCYETHGDPTDPALVLVMGFTAQLTSWPIEFVEGLVSRGFHVIRFDNRDAGLSTKTSGAPPDLTAVVEALTSGSSIEAPYTLADMALDVVGLLDHLAIETAHVVGASMGGMIVQELAIDHRHRLRSATSVMSTTGNPEVGAGQPEVMAALLEPAPTDPEAAIEHGTEVNRLLSGPLWDRERALERTRVNFERSNHPLGAAFQLAAIAATGDRTDRLKSVATPFLVIHGVDDPLINQSGGKATADAVPDAAYSLVEGMGHDLPAPRMELLCDTVAAHCR